LAYEQREGDIAIFQEREKKNPKGPDWKGTALINGQKMEVALWMKGDKGTMLAGSIKPAREAGERQRDDFRSGSPAPVAGGVHKFPDSDDVPW
jgi:hypothetical protein